jgi:hypothetical protein
MFQMWKGFFDRFKHVLNIGGHIYWWYNAGKKGKKKKLNYE